MELSVKDADTFCQKWGLPDLHLVRDCLIFPAHKELLQLDYWRLESMLIRSTAKELEYPKPNGFSELVENIQWNIENLKSKHQWLLPLDSPY